MLFLLVDLIAGLSFLAFLLFGACTFFKWLLPPIDSSNLSDIFPGNFLAAVLLANYSCFDGASCFFTRSWPFSSPFQAVLSAVVECTRGWPVVEALLYDGKSTGGSLPCGFGFLLLSLSFLISSSRDKSTMCIQIFIIGRDIEI